MQQVCCWVPHWQEISIDSRRRHSAATAPQHSTQQQTRTLSYWQQSWWGLAQTCWTRVNVALSCTHSRVTAFFLGLPKWTGTRKVKPIWILLKQETVSGRGISWAICKSAPCSRQTTTPATHRSVFYTPDALHAAQPTVSKHWRQKMLHLVA